LALELHIVCIWSINKKKEADLFGVTYMSKGVLWYPGCVIVWPRRWGDRGDRCDRGWVRVESRCCGIEKAVRYYPEYFIKYIRWTTKNLVMRMKICLNH
jgi:hypothetical protein